MRLTDLRVQSLKPPERGQKAYGDETLPGFALRVSQGGTKTFTLMVGRDRQLITIGRYPIISLADARTEAKRLLAERTLGKHRPGRRTYGEALKEFVEEKTAKNRSRTILENERLLTKYLPNAQNRPLSDFTSEEVRKVLTKLKNTPGTQLHVFWALKTFLNWCFKRGYVDASPVARFEPPQQIKFRTRILSDEELRAVWKAAETIGGNFGKITQLLILTGQRRSEIGSLQTSWITCTSSSTSPSATSLDISRAGVEERYSKPDCEDTRLLAAKETSSEHRRICTITLPSSITKNKRSHTFPVGGLGGTIISFSLSSSSDYVFGSRGSDGKKPFNGWSKSKAQLDKKITEGRDKLSPPFGPWTLHDLRRTYATNLQRLGIKLEIIEALLNHVSGTRAGIVGVYQRHRYEEEMREAVATFENWFTKHIVFD